MYILFQYICSIIKRFFCTITLVLAETLSGDMLPFQMKYTTKTSHSLPTAEFPEGFLLGFNKSHWSNEE